MSVIACPSARSHSRGRSTRSGASRAGAPPEAAPRPGWMNSSPPPATPVRSPIAHPPPVPRHDQRAADVDLALGGGARDRPSPAAGRDDPQAGHRPLRRVRQERDILLRTGGSSTHVAAATAPRRRRPLPGRRQREGDPARRLRAASPAVQQNWPRAKVSARRASWLAAMASASPRCPVRRVERKRRVEHRLASSLSVALVSQRSKRSCARRGFTCSMWRAISGSPSSPGRRRSSSPTRSSAAQQRLRAGQIGAGRPRGSKIPSAWATSRSRPARPPPPAPRRAAPAASAVSVALLVGDGDQRHHAPHPLRLRPRHPRRAPRSCPPTAGRAPPPRRRSPPSGAPAAAAGCPRARRARPGRAARLFQRLFPGDRRQPRGPPTAALRRTPRCPPAPPRRARPRSGLRWSSRWRSARRVSNRAAAHRSTPPVPALAPVSGGVALRHEGQHMVAGGQGLAQRRRLVEQRRPLGSSSTASASPSSASPNARLVAELLFVRNQFVQQRDQRPDQAQAAPGLVLRALNRCLAEPLKVQPRPHLRAPPQRVERPLPAFGRARISSPARRAASDVSTRARSSGPASSPASHLTARPGSTAAVRSSHASWCACRASGSATDRPLPTALHQRFQRFQGDGWGLSLYG